MSEQLVRELRTVNQELKEIYENVKMIPILTQQLKTLTSEKTTNLKYFDWNDASRPIDEYEKYQEMRSSFLMLAVLNKLHELVQVLVFDTNLTAFLLEAARQDDVKTFLILVQHDWRLSKFQFPKTELLEILIQNVAVGKCEMFELSCESCLSYYFNFELSVERANELRPLLQQQSGLDLSQWYTPPCQFECNSDDDDDDSCYMLSED